MVSAPVVQYDAIDGHLRFTFGVDVPNSVQAAEL
jgi:hypothetical protein